MAGEDPGFVAWVRTRSCMLAPLGCQGPVEAHHAGLDRGLGQRAADATSIPLCRGHHRAWHDACPPFRGLTQLERRAWATDMIARTQQARAAELGRGESEIPF